MQDRALTRVSRRAYETKPTADPVTLSIVVPAYNEEGAVAATVKRIRAALSELPMRFEIIVVDDGSTDGTRTAAGLSGAVVLSSADNDGYGSALKRGIAASQSDYVAIIDADGTYPPESLVPMIELAHTADMVVGNRGSTMRNVPIIRRPAKWVLNGLANYLARREIPDVNSGLRVFRRASLETFIPLLPDGFSFTTTITLAMLCTKRRVVYYPIQYAKRTGSSKIRAAHFFAFIVLLLRIVTLFEPLRIFIPLGGALFAVGLCKLIYDVTVWNLSETAVFSFLGALIIWSIGLIADMIGRLHLRP
jgi:glycosyltransferase involved in cell wall biosynthesis